MNGIFSEGDEGGGFLMRVPLKTLFLKILELVNMEKKLINVQNMKETTSLNCLARDMLLTDLE